MTLITAQGNGFYGLSIMTTETPVPQILEKLLEIGGEKAEGGGIKFDQNTPLKTKNQEGTVVMVQNIEGIAAPKPVSIYDSGNVEDEMMILNLLQAKI